MRSIAALVCSLLSAAPALAQREARAGAVSVVAQDTMCWSSADVPCEDIGRAEVEVHARAAARVRVVSVEVMAEGGGWQRAARAHPMRRGDMVRTVARRRPDGVVRFRAGERDTLLIHFPPIRAYEGRVRVTLDVNGRRVVVEAAHTVTHEHSE